MFICFMGQFGCDKKHLESPRLFFKFYEHQNIKDDQLIAGKKAQTTFTHAHIYTHTHALTDSDIGQRYSPQYHKVHTLCPTRCDAAHSHLLAKKILEKHPHKGYQGEDESKKSSSHIKRQKAKTGTARRK